MISAQEPNDIGGKKVRHVGDMAHRPSMHMVNLSVLYKLLNPFWFTVYLNIINLWLYYMIVRTPCSTLSYSC
jgi:hypothetical protein